MLKFKSKLLGFLFCGLAFSSVNCATVRPNGLIAAFRNGVLYPLDHNNRSPTINNFASRQLAYFVNGLTFLPCEILFYLFNHIQKIVYLHINKSSYRNKLATAFKNYLNFALCYVLLILYIFISQLTVEAICEAWSRYKKTMPEKQTPGVVGFCKDVFKRSICKGKDGWFNRKTSPPKILAKIFLYGFILGNVLRNNESIFTFVKP